MKATIQILFFITILPAFHAKAISQDARVDSLLDLYSKQTNDTTQIIALNELGSIYQNIDPDSSLYYFYKAISVIENIIGKSKPNKTNKKFYSLKATTLRNIGSIYNLKGQYPQAISSHLSALETAKAINDKTVTSHVYNSIGVVYRRQGNFDMALRYYLMSLEIAEEIGDLERIAACYNNIGIIHKDQNNNEQAMEYYLKYLALAEELKDNRRIARSFSNIGGIYMDKGNFDEALEYYTKSLELVEELSDKSAIARRYSNIGIVNKQLENFEKAIDYFHKALSINKDLGDKGGMATVYANIAELYISFSKFPGIQKDFDERNKRLKKAVEYGKKSIEIARDINATPRENKAAKVLMLAYEELGDYVKALEYSDVFLSTQESMFHDEKINTLAELQIRYETEQKQEEIERQNIIIEKREIEYKRQKLGVNLLIAGSTMLGMLVVIIFTGYKQRVKSNKIIYAKNLKLEQAYDEIMQKKEELQSQSNELEKINETLEERIADEIEKSREKDFLLIQQSRQAAMGEMIANIAHQWRQPLNAIGLIVQNIQESYEHNELTDKYIAKAENQSMEIIQYMSQTINDFRDFFKPEKAASLFDIKKAVLKSISFVENNLKNKDIQIEYSLSDDVFAYGFPNEYAQVVLNLINNATDALLENKVENPKIEIHLTTDNNKSCLTVADNGGGIKPEIGEKIFKPYFSTKKEAEGTGLGLYMSKTIIEKHEGGSLTFENTDDGVSFIIIL